ncbi:MAG: hypothetical protein HY072_07485, partial [Deltaproteobacteria bacterium]|nr:hypothetical protein [Deltaproteobacteria bacterium]
VEFESNLKAVNSSENISNLNFYIVPAWNVLKNLKTLFIFNIQKELVADRETKILKSDLGITYGPVHLNPHLSLTPKLGFILPLDYKKRVYESLILGLRSGIKLDANFTRIQPAYEISGTRFLHRYSTALNTKTNLKYQLSQKISFDITPELTPLQPLVLSSALSLVSAWTYFGTLLNRFEWNQEASYELNSHLALLLGISNSGDLLKANGYESNIAFWNENQTTYYFSLSFKNII